ncbi:MAG: hypothetical protein JWQ66_1685 [Mucilaginibacter sp.]|nr:hypothetical protein [Mucilaginibacter sp.]
MFTLTDYNNADAAVIKLLKSLSINIAPTAIIAELEKHPDYPSLLAISDVLNNFNIENSAFRIQPDGLINVPCPFIAHTHLSNGDFVVVDQFKNQDVVISGEKWTRHKMSLLEFKTIFSGVVLTAESSKDLPTSATFTSVLNRLKVPFVVTGLTFIIITSLAFHTAYFTNYTWQLLLFTVFKSTGLMISILLLIQSIDSNNPLIQKLCKGGSKTDCNAILSSKAAKVFEGLSWSEVGFFYFAGTWLLLLFGNNSAPIILALAFLNIISLPYTFYSIYYQARIAKQWCILCCTVQALLWLEFIPLVTTFHQPLTLPGPATWSTLFICLLMPVILWVLLKPLLLKVQQLKPLKQQLRRFKYNTELFNKILDDQPKYEMPDESWSIVLGNVEANNSITMVTNPYCPPCSKMHKLLDDLLDESANVQARIIFTASNTDEDIKTPVSRHLMALNELPDKTIVKKALNDWYAQKQKNYKAWARIYPVQLNEANYQKIDRQKAWCEIAEVIATPTVLLNGYRLPDLYQVTDLKYMLE